MKILDTYLPRACLILLTPAAFKQYPLASRSWNEKNKLGENANEQYLVTYTLDTAASAPLLLINV